MENNREERTVSARADNGALRWAVNNGILPSDSQHAFVTREELAGVVYRALEHFFGQVVSILEADEE